MTIINIDISQRKYYEKFRRDIGRFLFSRRQKEKYSLAKVAALTGIKPELLDRIELGRHNIKTLVIMKLLSLYHSHVIIKFEKKGQEVPTVEIE